MTPTYLQSDIHITPYVTHEYFQIDFPDYPLSDLEGTPKVTPD